MINNVYRLAVDVRTGREGGVIVLDTWRRVVGL
jgi:hypothetical protein